MNITCYYIHGLMLPQKPDKAMKSTISLCCSISIPNQLAVCYSKVGFGCTLGSQTLIVRLLDLFISKAKLGPNRILGFQMSLTLLNPNIPWSKS